MENKSYSKVYRIVHWLIAIAFLLLLVTIFLRLTWLNKNNIADIIQAYLTSTGQSLSHDQLIILAKQIRQPMWQWHIYLGYALVLLFSVRILLPLLGEMKFQSPFEKTLPLKQKFQRWSYIIFSLCVAVSLITGLLITLGPKDINESIEEIHKLSLYYLIPYILIHVSGILIAEFTDDKGIISKIISGSQSK